MKYLFNRQFWQLSIISGVLTGLAYPPLHMGFLAWVSFVPLIYIFLNSSPKHAGKYGFLASITANLISLYWIGLNSGAGFIPVFLSLIGAVLYLGIFWWGLGYFIASIQHRIGQGLTVFPFAFIAMEYLRSLGALGFPWINLALTQTQYLQLIQVAEITGTYGVGFWIILLNVGVYLILSNTKDTIKISSIVAIIMVLNFGYGILRLNNLNEPDVKPVTIAITQPNINPDEKWEPEAKEQNFALMHSLLDSALILKPDMVLWPESAVPSYLRLSKYRRMPIHKKVIQSGIPLLTGAIDRIIDAGQNKIYYNGTMYMMPDGNYQMYYKVHLVPFAEYVPLSKYFPKLNDLNFGQGQFTAGEEFTVFKLGSVNFSNMICYESSLPKITRGFVKNGAQFIALQANDGWLGMSSGPYQHFELAKLRAVENRIPILRCANTGISGVITAAGRVKQKIPLGVKSIYMAKIIPSQGKTFYTKFGDIFAQLCLLISIIFLGSIWLKHFQK